MTATAFDASQVALQVLEAIRATHPDLIADSMPPNWGMFKLREALAIKDPWDRDDIQFPLLLAEISATQDRLDLKALADSMDLSVDDVIELLERAHVAWALMAAKVAPPAIDAQRGE